MGAAENRRVYDEQGRRDRRSSCGSHCELRLGGAPRGHLLDRLSYRGRGARVRSWAQRGNGRGRPPTRCMTQVPSAAPVFGMTPERREFDAPHRSNVEASSEEVGVATARFVKTGITPDEYDQMREKLGVGDTPPAGGVFHAAAVGEDGKIRVFEVWDSREQAEAWGEKVMAVRTEAGFGDGAALDRIPRRPQSRSALVGSGQQRRERLRSLAPALVCASVRE